MSGLAAKTISGLGNATSLRWQLLRRGNGGVEVLLAPCRLSDGCLCEPILRLEGVRLLLVLWFVTRRRQDGLQMRSASRTTTCGLAMWFQLASG